MEQKESSEVSKAKAFSSWLWTCTRTSLGSLALWGVLSTPAFADAQSDLQQSQRRLRRLENNVRLLMQTSVNIAPESRVSLRKRLADGQLNFLLKDYLRASIILLDAVENPRNRNQMAWYDAVYYLAESLYRNRNTQGALKHYQTLVRLRRQHSQKALVRLMEIASQTKRYSWLNQYFQQGTKLLGQGPLRDKIYYLRAKGLYEQGSRLKSGDPSRAQYFSQARNLFGQIPGSSSFRSRALYFIATIDLQVVPLAQSLPRAVQLMGQALNLQNKKDKKMRDTILLALGRLYLEQSMINRALEYYQKIDRRSHVFDQSLYEICWGYIREAQRHKKLKQAAIKAKNTKTIRRENKTIKLNYQRALRTLGLLIAFQDGNSPFYPKAQLLRAHLLLQIESFKKSMTNYEKVVNKYSEVYRKMDNILKQQTNLRQTLETLITRQLDQFSVAALLPQEAIRWMSDEDLMKRALLMLRDLKDMNLQLKDSRRIIQRLESALRIPDRLSLSPSLKDVQVQGIGYRNETTQLLESLNKITKQLVYPKMTASERQQYEALNSRIASMQLLYQRTAKNKREINQREQMLTQRIDGLKARLHKMNLSLQYAFLEVSSIRRWLSNHPKAAKMTPTQRTQIVNEVNQIEAEAKQIDRSRQALKQQLELARIKLSVTPGRQETQVQQNYSSLLQQEQALLSRVQSRATGADAQAIREIQDARRRLRAVQGKLNQFFVRQNRLMTRYASVMQRRVSTHKQQVSQYETQVAALSLQGRRLASQIAYQSFLAVRQKFYNLVLEADVGVLDVVWQEKRANQYKIQQLEKSRNEELRVLDSEFKDILQEVK